MRKLWISSALVCLMFTSVGSDAGNRQLDIHWVDVEGGAATLIVTPAGESILVDTGWPDERGAPRVAKVAKAIGLQQIDHLITSHWHTDHFGGHARLAELLPVKNWYDHGFPELPKNDITPALVEAYRKATGGKSIVLKPGDTIPLKQTRGAPRLSLQVVAGHGIVSGEKPDAPQTRPCDKGHAAKHDDPSDNARSLAFVLKFGDWKFFNAGDLTWNVEHKLVCPTNLVGEVDLYQVTHHGADNSNHPAVLAALQPRVAVMNNGPKKGGVAASVQTIKATKSVEGFFAVHRNVNTGPADNADPTHTANEAEQCTAETIKLAVAVDGKSYTVTVPRKATIKTFKTK